MYNKIVSTDELINIKKLHESLCRFGKVLD